MKINTKIKKYVEANGNIVKDYPTMCQVLKEKETTGGGRTSQLKRWKIYFDFKKQGHKFIITDVCDEKTVNENQKAKKMSNISARSKYRNNVIPALLYLLSRAENNTIFEPKLKVAISCGFFDYEIDGKRRTDKYIKYREEMMVKHPDKPYYKVDMDKFTYCTYYNNLKKCAFKIILGALGELKKLNIVDYSIVNVGINYDLVNPQISELSAFENDIYIRCVEEACSEVLPLYNSVAKIKKEKVTPADFMFRETVRESYYSTVNQLVSKKLGYDMVMEYLKIDLIKNVDEIEGDFRVFKTAEEFCASLENINDTFVASMRASIDKMIISSKNFHIYSRMISFNSKEHYATLKQGKEEKKQEEKYYNKMEILDTLVSTKGNIDVIDLEEFEEKYYDCTWIDRVASEEFSKLKKYEEETDDDVFIEEDESQLQEILKFFYNK